MFRFAYRVSFAAALSLAVLIPTNSALGATVPCRSAIAKASAKFAQSEMKALVRCEKLVTLGKLPAETTCTTEAKTANQLARAADKLTASIAEACGGADGVCGNGDDDPLAAIGWDIGTCPDFESNGCDAAISSCSDIAACLVCVGDAATARLSSLYHGAFNTGGGSALEKCRAGIGKAAGKFFAAKSKALQKCWAAVSSGQSAGPCPDQRATNTIAKAESKKVRSICKACGGGDRGCDGSTGGVEGTGGTDDLDVGTIGFVGTCPDVTVASTAASCAGDVDDLAGLVGCVDCVTEADADCIDAAAVPWALPYPFACGGDAVTTTSTTTSTSVTTTSLPSDDLIYAESFGGPNGSPWPAPWVELANSAADAELWNGRARFRPEISGYSLARMFYPASERDVDITLTVEWEDFESQGLGIYARQNGGHLTATVPAGEGYASFTEGFRGTDGVGVWKEIAGSEIDLSINFGLALDIQSAVPYRIRFREYQESAGFTRLLTRAWPLGDPEPSDWDVDLSDDEPLLRGITGGFALDAWSSATSGSPGAFIYVDDIEIRRIENPLLATGPVVTIGETFQFLEGPHWRATDGELLFTDIPVNTIYSLVPPSTVTVFRTPSDNANGLATDVTGELLAAEHGTRRISRTAAGGAVTTVASQYLGDSLNSPNDIAVRSDGTLYFTDPPYGIDPGDQELAFNGVFRVPSGGGLVAEYEGGLAERPNGVVLSPDESTLYVSDTALGNVTAWDVAVDGSLSNARTFTSATPVADGMCVDEDGNLYVTSSDGLEVFAPDGMQWGTLAIPRQASNCGFGGAGLTTLYVTAREGLYSFAASIPGAQ